MPGLTKINYPFTDGMKAMTTLPTHARPYSWAGANTKSGGAFGMVSTGYIRSVKRSYAGIVNVEVEPGNKSVKA